MIVKFKKLNNDAEIPTYGTEGSAGFDLVVNNFKKLYRATNQFSAEIVEEPDFSLSNENTVPNIELTPHSRVLLGCGYSVAIPEGTQLEVRSRSGKALKEGLIVLNQPGTIDSDYRGEVGVILYNSSMFPITIVKGDKVAQAILMPYIKAEIVLVEDLDATERGAGGYGSTDKKETLNY